MSHVTQLPLTRVKNVIKSDPDITLASQEAVILIAKVGFRLYVWRTTLPYQPDSSLVWAPDPSGRARKGLGNNLARKCLERWNAAVGVDEGKNAFQPTSV